MEQERTYKWIQDRLRDLRSGTISEEDRLHLEEIARTDPFIQDAMEGYIAHKDLDHSALLKVLSQRIENKKYSRRPKLLPLSRGWLAPAVAALFVIILGTWAVIYYLQKQGQTSYVSAESIAKDSTERSVEVQLNGTDSAGGNLALDETSSVEMSHEPEKAGGREQGAGRQGETNLQNQKAYTSDDLVASKPAAAPPINVEAKEEPEENTLKTNEALPASAGVDFNKSTTKKDEGYYANQMNPADMNQRVTGQIMSRKGNALTGAMIGIPNSNLITTTDAHGKFELYLPHQTSTVEVSNSGYRDTTITMMRGQENIAITLDEKQVDMPVGALAGSESKAQRSSTEKQPGQIPKDDKTTFLEYLKTKSHYPIENTYTPTSKSVKVTFTVSTDKRPYIIKSIDSSADSNYIAEAIRLIKNGPDWRCDGDQSPCEKEYTIYFK